MHAGGIGGVLRKKFFSKPHKGYPQKRRNFGGILLAVIRNGLNILNVSSFWQQVVIGLVIAFAVSFDTLRRKIDVH